MNCFQISTLLVKSQQDQIQGNHLGVVNCFQISTLLVKSQQSDRGGKEDLGCELLSNQYFTSEITAPVFVV